MATERVTISATKWVTFGLILGPRRVATRATMMFKEGSILILSTTGPQ